MREIESPEVVPAVSRLALAVSDAREGADASLPGFTVCYCFDGAETSVFPYNMVCVCFEGEG